MSTPRFSKFAVTLVSSLLIVFLSTIALAQLQIGSGNTAYVEPPIPHPNTTPCKVQLYTGFVFNNFNAHSFSYTPPADCPGPWAAVILSADFSISAGVQYDRTANIWIGPTNIYFGTTAEDQPNEGRHWHVERNLIDYSAVFTVPQDGTVDLGNEVNKTYTGVLYGSATVFFYPVPKNEGAPQVPDQVIGFSAGSTGGTVGLGSPTNLLEQTLTLPTNIESVFLDVLSQGQSEDEFWYTCAPNNVAVELYGDCPSTAFRESEITIDGTPAGVAPVYPWIFTGGIDPFLWIPIPGVQTLNLQPYRVNLTPFASLLDDGNPHTIAVSVFNADNYFSATASLLLYLDDNATQLTGDVTSNTLAAPNPNVVEHLTTGKNGTITGTINTTSSHNFEISGYINTSRGPVTTTVSQAINFSNLSYFKFTATEVPTYFEQKIDQSNTVHSLVTTKSESGTTAVAVNRDWPLKIEYSSLVAADGSGSQTTTSNQYLETDSETRRNGQATAFSLSRNRVVSHDVLSFSSTSLSNADQWSLQNFFSSDSNGYCYGQDLTAANNVLTGIVNGVGCN